MREGLRFDPPPVVFTPEVRWALLRAFGPPERVFAQPLDAEVATGLASTLDLGPRIAARTPLEALQAELGEGGARSLLIANVKAALITAEILKCARLVAEAAAGLSVPVVFLKGVALRLTGVVEEGWRWLSDVDVLAPAGGARALAEALMSRGFRSDGVPSQEQHLPPLKRGSLEMVELHNQVLGVRLSSRRRYATLEELQERGLLVLLPEMPGACFVPARELLVAHALAHGLAQHGLAPGSYPMTRMLADLVDLGLAGPDGARLLDAAHPWIARDVSRDETGAAMALCAALTKGDEALFAPESGRLEAVLLGHVAAGLTDDGYRTALRLAGLWGAPSGHARPIAWAITAFHTVFLTRAQVDMIYGRPRTELGYLGRRLARPLDLAWRLGRYAASAIRLRLRRVR